MIRLALLNIVLLFGAVLSAESNQTHDGFGYELIQSKLDYLEFRFSELFLQLKEQSEDFLINQQRMEAAQQQLNLIVERHERKIVQLVEGLEDSVGSNVSLISNQSLRIMELQTICSNHDQIRDSLFELRPKNATIRPNQGTFPCSELSGKTSGLCSMSIGGEKTVVFMEQHRFGGNWLVILQRFDGSENDFNRNWVDYRAGFGTVGQEFWLGLQRMHLLTNSGSNYELMVEMEDFAGNYRYARYDKFAIGSEAELYALKEVGTHSGTAGDSLTSHKGAKFTTKDKAVEKQCVDSYTGGWWYIPPGMCYNTHLTGKWDRANAWQSIVWKKFGSPENTALKFARMMIRKK